MYAQVEIFEVLWMRSMSIAPQRAHNGFKRSYKREK